MSSSAVVVRSAWVNLLEYVFIEYACGVLLILRGDFWGAVDTYIQANAHPQSHGFSSCRL